MVKQRKTGGSFYYEFRLNGEKYHGTCENCKTKREAEKFEAQRKKELEAISDTKTVKELVELQRRKLTRSTPILLADAFEKSLNKPRQRQPNEKSVKQKRGEFADFVAFMAKRYPSIQQIADVTFNHAEEYISLIRTKGRFLANVTYSRGGKEISRASTGKLSSRTANHYQTTCAEVFRLLARESGIIDNPFDMPKLPKDEAIREAFTDEELRLIYKNLDNFTRPLFFMAIFTALREGDICTLRWSDIDFNADVIRRTMNKTKNKVEIPILPDLANFLRELQTKSGKGEYVFPELEKMYRTNPTGISYRIKKFLEGIGIQTTMVPEGRKHAVSIKDLHSCRHTFCTLAGLADIPLTVVQSIVGHMSPKMTEHYSAHVSLANKKDHMEAIVKFMPNQMLLEDKPQRNATLAREKLRALVDKLSDEEVYDLLAKYDR